MARRQTQTVESRHFARFLELASAPSEASWEHGDAPDFVQRGQQVIGVEHTQLFRLHDEDRPPHQAREAEQWRICTAAKELAIEAGVPSLNVRVEFSPYADLSKRKYRNEPAQSLFELVQDQLPLEILESRELRSQLVSARLGRISSAIRVFRDPSGTHMWYPGGAYWSGLCTPAMVQQVLTKKSCLAATYRQKVDESWLLIVMDDTAPSGDMLIEDQVAEHAYQGEFDRAFLMSFMDRSLLDLKVYGTIGPPP